MAPQKVALAGATGNLGVPVLEALLAAGHEVTVLTRKGSDSASKLASYPNLTVKEVDYTSVPELTEAIKGTTVVVSTLATESLAGQTPLIDASIAAGVKRFIPSEFGSNTLNQKAAALPVFKYKVESAKYLQSKAAENPDFTYTQLITGPFLDWGLKVGFMANPAQRTATVFNGGDVTFSSTTLASIGKAVAGVVAHLPETANRAVYVYDALVSQNQLISYGQEKGDGKAWDITHKETSQIYQDSIAALSKGPAPDALGAIMVGFIFCAIFDPSYGGNFEGFDDNQLLGIKTWSEDQVKALVQSFV